MLSSNSLVRPCIDHSLIKCFYPLIISPLFVHLFVLVLNLQPSNLIQILQFSFLTGFKLATFIALIFQVAACFLIILVSRFCLARTFLIQTASFNYLMQSYTIATFDSTSLQAIFQISFFALIIFVQLFYLFRLTGPRVFVFM